MRYENALRALESAVGSVVGWMAVSCIRRPLYRPMRPDQLPDFVLPLAVVEQGCRVVYAPEACCRKKRFTSEDAEYRMRVRVTLRALWALWDKRVLLNPVRFPLFSWQLTSHQASAVPELPAAGSRRGDELAARVTGWIYATLAAGQCCAALLALLALRGPARLRGFFLARYCYYFLLLNWASAVALVRFLRGDKQVLWQPRAG